MMFKEIWRRKSHFFPSNDLFFVNFFDVKKRYLDGNTEAWKLEDFLTQTVKSVLKLLMDLKIVSK